VRMGHVCPATRTARHGMKGGARQVAVNGVGLACRVWHEGWGGMWACQTKAASIQGMTLRDVMGTCNE